MDDDSQPAYKILWLWNVIHAELKGVRGVEDARGRTDLLVSEKRGPA